LAGIVLLLAVLALGWASQAARAAEPVTVTDYTDPAEALAWGQQSHWKQPWRSYLDTMPGSALRNGVGINFNVQPKQAASTARLLAEDGFHRARVEIGWNSLDFADPTQLSEAGRKNLETFLSALRDNGIRPLILLNANDGQPCPVRLLTLHLTAPAAAGSTVIHVSPADVGEIAPGRTGIPYKGKAAYQLITSVDPNGTAQLSKPLGTTYPAGDVKAETLRYEPFSGPRLGDGSPNPRFERTMAGWINYVKVVTTETKRVLGSDDFDVEVWNELGFGSAFLNVNNYYEPDIEPSRQAIPGEILRHTIAYVRNPANGIPNVGVGNGFSNQRPWDNGTESPLGLSAIDKHPYSGWAHFPTAALQGGNRPLDGLGQPTGTLDAQGKWHEIFTPTYDAFFPERFLSAINTETLVHDLSPTPTWINHVEHGRFSHPEGGSPPRMWITEVNLSPTGGPVPGAQMSQADIRHVETKEVLRYITAFVNKGVEAIDLYAANAGTMSLVDKPFLQAASANPAAYPGRDLGGETMTAVRRLTDAMKGSRITDARSLELRALTDFNGNVQFAGNPNDPVHYPPLYNRDVFAFFPFQTSNTRFVIPMYVMTRDVVKEYGSHSPGDPTRFDLPEERYRLRIGGVNGVGAIVSALDPVTGELTPAEVVSAGTDEVVVDVDVTDSPRLLTIQELGLDSGQAEDSDRAPAGVGEVPGEESEETEPPVEEGEEIEPPVEEGEDEGSPGEEEEPEQGGETPGDEGEEASGGGGEEPPDGSAPDRRSSTRSAIQEGTTPGEEVTVAISLKRPRALLSGGTMRIVGRCVPDCRLLLAARLSAGNGHPYRMFQRPRRVSPATGSPILSFGISAREAKIARRAIRDGARLKVVVSGRAEYGGGSSRPVLEQIVLRP
jgi:hypothetical protein